MVTLYLITLVTALMLSWALFRSPLHPHFLFTLAISNILILPYITEGDAHRLIAFIPTPQLYYYQLYILMFYIGVIAVAALISIAKPTKIGFSTLIQPPTPTQRTWIFLGAIAILSAELMKRIVASDWNLEAAFQHSLAARADRPWVIGGYVGGGKHVYILLGYIFPLAGLGFAYLTAAYARWRLLTLPLMLFVLVILVTDGSRTPVVFLLGAWTIFTFIYQRGLTSRVAVAVIAAVLIASLTSMMLLYRNAGFSEWLNPTHGSQVEEFRTLYHQDDTYYWALYAIHHREQSGHRPDAFTFFAAAMVNPIPRALWPNKPFLHYEYWQGYKHYWITSGSLGELVAVLGATTGFALTVALTILMYLALLKSAEIARKPVGVVYYLAFSLYMYMIFRSFPNITQFIYLPMATYIVLYWLFWRKAARPRHAHAMQHPQPPHMPPRAGSAEQPKLPS